MFYLLWLLRFVPSVSSVSSVLGFFSTKIGQAILGLVIALAVIFYARHDAYEDGLAVARSECAVKFDKAVKKQEYENAETRKAYAITEGHYRAALDAANEEAESIDLEVEAYKRMLAQLGEAVRKEAPEKERSCGLTESDLRSITKE